MAPGTWYLSLQMDRGCRSLEAASRHTGTHQCARAFSNWPKRANFRCVVAERCVSWLQERFGFGSGGLRTRAAYRRPNVASDIRQLMHRGLSLKSGERSLDAVAVASL